MCGERGHKLLAVKQHRPQLPLLVVEARVIVFLQRDLEFAAQLDDGGRLRFGRIQKQFVSVLTGQNSQS